MEANTVFVNSDHVLSRYAVFKSPALRVCGIDGLLFNSVEMIVWYVSMIQDERKPLAERMRNDIVCKNQPVRIRQWALDRGYEPSTSVVVLWQGIYDAVVTDQIRQERSPFRRAFQELLEKRLPNATKHLDFIVCSNNPDFVWDCGLNGTHARRHLKTGFIWPGANRYGVVLRTNAVFLTSGKLPDDMNVKSYIHTLQHLDRFPRRTIFVASDSICSPITGIHSGEIYKRGGGRFGSIATDLSNLRVRFWDFDCVTLSIGINDAQDSVWKREQSWFMMQDFLCEQIQIRGYPAYKILINLPVPHWDAPAVPEYNHWIIEQINVSMPGVQVINWAAMDSDMFGDDGYPTDRMYSDDYFHLSHAGIYRFWKQWVSVFSRLQNVGYTVVNVKKEH